MITDPPLSRKEKVELEKLIAEKELLQSQLTPQYKRVEFLKAVAGIAGVFTAFVAFGGLIFSYCQYQGQVDVDRKAHMAELEARATEKLNKNIALLSEKSPAKQLAGIAALTPILENGNGHSKRQILNVFARILAVEEKHIVRDAFISTFSNLDTKLFDPNTLQDCLDTLIVANRSLVVEGKLRDKRRNHPRQELKLNGIEARASSLAWAITTLLGLGVKKLDLSEIYCVGCNFSGLDLRNVNFDNAMLYLSDFSNSTLDEASFDGADIERTSFQSASLKKAKLTLREDTRHGEVRSSYIWRSFENENHDTIFAPNFNCSDLRGADFTGHSIFSFVIEPDKENTKRPSIYVSEASFVGADLQDASFEKAKMFGTMEEGLRLPFFSGSSSAIEEDGYRLFEANFRNIPSTKYTETDRYNGSLFFLKKGFSGSSWSSAKFPTQMHKWLKDNPPDKDMDFGQTESCIPRSNRTGFDPKPVCRFRKAISAEEIRIALKGTDDEALLDIVTCDLQKREVLFDDLRNEEKIIMGAWKASFLPSMERLYPVISEKDTYTMEFLRQMSVGLKNIGMKDTALKMENILTIIPNDVQVGSLPEDQLKLLRHSMESITAKLEADQSKLNTLMAVYIRDNKNVFIKSFEKK